MNLVFSSMEYKQNLIFLYACQKDFFYEKEHNAAKHSTICSYRFRKQIINKECFKKP